MFFWVCSFVCEVKELNGVRNVCLWACELCCATVRWQACLLTADDTVLVIGRVVAYPQLTHAGVFLLVWVHSYIENCTCLHWPYRMGVLVVMHWSGWVIIMAGVHNNSMIEWLTSHEPVSCLNCVHVYMCGPPTMLHVLWSVLLVWPLWCGCLQGFVSLWRGIWQSRRLLQQRWQVRDCGTLRCCCCCCCCSCTVRAVQWYNYWQGNWSAAQTFLFQCVRHFGYDLHFVFHCRW